MKAYIFGNGPAGLMAAHAAEQAGYDVEIGAQQLTPSRISGAQYLNRAIPGLTPDAPDTQITFYKLGKAENYARKIYGDKDAPSSWDKYDDQVEYAAWFLRDHYSHLWEHFAKKMFHVVLNADVLNAFCETDAELIVSTIPLPELCFNKEHEFKGQSVTIYDGVPTDIPDRLQFLMQQDNWILYNGKKKTPWYRASCINQGAYVEVPGFFDDGFKLSKPLTTTCDCWTQRGDPRIILTGRYGAWQKDLLVSSAYEAVLDAVQ